MFYIFFIFFQHPVPNLLTKHIVQKLINIVEHVLFKQQWMEKLVQIFGERKIIPWAKLTRCKLVITNNMQFTFMSLTFYWPYFFFFVIFLI